MAFSWTGLVLILLILLPNAAFLLLPPRDIPEKKSSAHAIFVILERIGQAGCFVLPMFTELRLVLGVWPVLCLICLLVYYSLWLRYITKGRGYKWLFAPFLKIPVPMAVFPVAVFGFAAVWGQSVWLGLAAVVLAAGHITVSLNEYQNIPRD